MRFKHIWLGGHHFASIVPIFVAKSIGLQELNIQLQETKGILILFRVHMISFVGVVKLPITIFFKLYIFIPKVSTRPNISKKLSLVPRGESP